MPGLRQPDVHDVKGNCPERSELVVPSALDALFIFVSAIWLIATAALVLNIIWDLLRWMWLKAREGR